MSSGYLRYPHVRGELLTFVAGDDVWLAPAAGGRAWRLSADDVPVSYPRFSRDGSRVAWTSWRDGNPEAYSADIADLLWEVLGELGTSHAYVTAASDGTRNHVPVGQLGADITRDTAGRWAVDRVLPGESSDPRARSPLAAPGVAISPGDELVAVDGQLVDSRRGPWPLLAGAAGKPVRLALEALDKQPPPPPPKVSSGPVKSRRPLPPR